jgi:hypothetical protein
VAEDLNALGFAEGIEILWLFLTARRSSISCAQEGKTPDHLRVAKPINEASNKATIKLNHFLESIQT